MPTPSPYLKAKDLKVPPHSIEAEKALLGSVMIRPEVMHEIIDLVNERSFYSNQHRIIWGVLFELHAKTTHGPALRLGPPQGKGSIGRSWRHVLFDRAY